MSWTWCVKREAVAAQLLRFTGPLVFAQPVPASTHPFCPSVSVVSQNTPHGQSIDHTMVCLAVVAGAGAVDARVLLCRFLEKRRRCAVAAARVLACAWRSMRAGSLRPSLGSHFCARVFIYELWYFAKRGSGGRGGACFDGPSPVIGFVACRRE